MSKIVVFLFACVAFASAMPFMVEDEAGQQYYVEPVVLERHRRDLQFAPGGGGANKYGQGGAINFNNGAGISGSHSRIPGVGHIVSGDVRMPVWSSKNKYGESTVSLGGGATEYIGRYGNQNLDKRVAVLDIDICGPSQPRVLGVQDEQVHQSGSGWSPVYVDDNLSLMSIGFLLSSPDDAIIWRGPKKNGMIRQFLSEVDWGKLDYLLIDTPPGTSDEHLSAVTYLSEANLTGAIIVTTPQEVALLDVRKEIDFCKKVKINILGVIENMSAFICPCCQKEAQIFPANTGGAKQMCQDLNVPFLGSLPLDPKVARCCDEGKDFIVELPDSPVVKSLGDIVKELISKCNGS